ncbi:prephenate dehydrogenase [Streptomyces sp. NPDC020681]|uniref:prephenate dehydrogenase n=1 Tax=Streptomyces sp. NPDC020681 TaxID=3365083 RepID=UPI0037A8B7A2
MRTVIVVGTGLIGTSAALALAARGVEVYLEDHDPAAARTAVALGAGTDDPPDGPVDLAIITAPPAHVAAAVADAQRRGLARGYLDVASVKAGLFRDLETLGCDLTSYIGTHPMSGRERSRSLVANADLFEGRPWVLTPSPVTETEVLNLALELVALCRAVPVIMDPESHDRAVALVLHTPRLVSSMVAARFQDTEDRIELLCGHGIRDVTRIAASQPGMWIDILSASPGPVVDVLADIAADLTDTIAALRALQSADDAKRRDAASGIEDLFRRGNAGRAKVTGKHGSTPKTYDIVAVLIDGQPGELARVVADAGRAGVNIEDIRIEHLTGQQARLVQLMVEAAAAPRLSEALRKRGWPGPEASVPHGEGLEKGPV